MWMVTASGKGYTLHSAHLTGHHSLLSLLTSGLIVDKPMFFFIHIVIVGMNLLSPVTPGCLFEKVKHLRYLCWWVGVNSCSLEGLKCRHQLWENTLVLNIMQADGIIINRVMNVAIAYAYNLRISNVQNRALWQIFGVVPNLGYL